jgi:hypothetical protein
MVTDLYLWDCKIMTNVYLKHVEKRIKEIHERMIKHKLDPRKKLKF